MTSNRLGQSLKFCFFSTPALIVTHFMEGEYSSDFSDLCGLCMNQ